MTTDNRRTRGFSLLEVLITVVVLSVALLALAKFQGDSIKEGSIAKKRTEAANLAQQQIETMRNFSNPAQFNALANGNNTVDGQTDTFTRSWVFTAVAGNPNLRLLTVRVRWPDVNGNLPADNDTTAETKVILTSAISLANPAMIAQAAAGPAAPPVVPPTTVPNIIVPPTTVPPTTAVPGSTTAPGTTTTSAAPTTTTTTTTIFYIYKCSCTYQNAEHMTIRVVPQVELPHCKTCSIAACNARIPAQIKNNEDFNIACP